MPRATLAVFTLGLALLACTRLSLPSSPFQPQQIPTDSAASDSQAIPRSDSLTQIPLHAGRGMRAGWYEVYFTDPANPASAQFSGGLDGPLVRAIDEAHLTVHVAVYSLTLHDVRAALVRAHRRGIDVRVVMESDNMDGEDPQALKEAGVSLLGDRRQGLMHDKFMIIDGTDVWTGSMNYTYSGTYLDNNNLIHIRSSDVAQDYETEFNEMFVHDRFGPDIGARIPHPRVDIEGTAVEVYFSPDDHVQSALVDILDGARSSIEFLAFSFTADPLGDALVRASSAGIKVRGVMDADQMQSNLGTEFDAFRASGLDVRLDGNPGQMHDKVLIVDGEIVAFGSYNFTGSAERTNDENLVVIHSPTVAALFAQEFQRIYALAGP